MHTGHRGLSVCVSPAASRLAINFICALYLHEIGHPLAMKLWGRSEQVDADESVRRVYGIGLRYRGPILIQWVSDRVARRLLGGRSGP